MLWRAFDQHMDMVLIGFHFREGKVVVGRDLQENFLESGVNFIREDSVSIFHAPYDMVFEGVNIPSSTSSFCHRLSMRRQSVNSAQRRAIQYIDRYSIYKQAAADLFNKSTAAYFLA